MKGVNLGAFIFAPMNNQGRAIDGLPTGALIPLAVNWARRLQSVFSSAAQVNPPCSVRLLFHVCFRVQLYRVTYIGCPIEPSSKTEDFMRAQPVSSFESELCKSINVFFIKIGR